VGDAKWGGAALHSRKIDFDAQLRDLNCSGGKVPERGREEAKTAKVWVKKKREKARHKKIWHMCWIKGENKTKAKQIIDEGRGASRDLIFGYKTPQGDSGRLQGGSGGRGNGGKKFIQNAD